MGMSTHITGVRDLDGKFAKMAEIKEACENAGMQPPMEVIAYFGGTHQYRTDIESLKQEMEEVDIKVALREVKGIDMENRWEVDIAKLPQEVKSIRISNLY